MEECKPITDIRENELKILCNSRAGYKSMITRILKFVELESVNKEYLLDARKKLFILHNKLKDCDNKIMSLDPKRVNNLKTERQWQGKILKAMKIIQNSINKLDGDSTGEEANLSETNVTEAINTDNPQRVKEENAVTQPSSSANKVSPNTLTDLDKFKRRLIRSVARYLVKEKMPENEAFEKMREETGCDCKKLWERMRSLTIKKLQRLLTAGDKSKNIASVGRMSLTDWLMFDLVLVHEDIDVIGKETMDKLKMASEPLLALFLLVQRFNIESCSADNLAEAWTSATIRYNSMGHQCSPMLMQRRWYQLKRATRDAFYNYWYKFRGSVVNLNAANEIKPTELQTAIVKRYPNLILTPLMPWEEMIKNDLVIMPEVFEEKMKSTLPSSIDENEVLVIEPEIDAVEIGDESDSERSEDSESSVNSTDEKQDITKVKIKTEKEDDSTEEYSLTRAEHFTVREKEAIANIENAAFELESIVADPVTNELDASINELDELAVIHLNTVDTTNFSKIPDDVSNELDVTVMAGNMDLNNAVASSSLALGSSTSQPAQPIEIGENDSSIENNIKHNTNNEPIFNTKCAQRSTANESSVEGDITWPQITYVMGNVDLSVITNMTTKTFDDADIETKVNDSDDDVIIGPVVETEIYNTNINEKLKIKDTHIFEKNDVILNIQCNKTIEKSIEESNKSSLDEQIKVNERDIDVKKSNENINQISEIKNIPSDLEIQMVEPTNIFTAHQTSKHENDVIITDLDFSDDGIEFIDDGIEFEDNDRAAEIKASVEVPIIKTEQIKENDEEYFSENGNTGKFDLKLLMDPLVCTLKLDDMKVFKIIPFECVKSEELIKEIEAASKITIPKLEVIKIKEESVAIEEKEIYDDIFTHDIDDSAENSVIDYKKRLKLTSYLLNKPKVREYNFVQLCKNPDFNTRLKRLNVGFFGSTRNRELLKACKPLTIDVSKAFEQKLIDGTIYLKDVDKTQPIASNSSDISTIQSSNVTIPTPTVAMQSLFGALVTNMSSSPQEEPILTPERNTVINLPNINEVSSINQKLLTAEVLPININIDLGNSTPVINSSDSMNNDINKNFTKDAITENIANSTNAPSTQKLKREVNSLELKETKKILTVTEDSKKNISNLDTPNLDTDKKICEKSSESEKKETPYSKILREKSHFNKSKREPRRRYNIGPARSWFSAIRPQNNNEDTLLTVDALSKMIQVLEGNPLPPPVKRKFRPENVRSRKNKSQTKIKSLNTRNTAEIVNSAVNSTLLENIDEEGKELTMKTPSDKNTKDKPKSDENTMTKLKSDNHTVEKLKSDENTIEKLQSNENTIENLNENTIEKLQSDEKTIENHLQSKVVEVNVIHAQNDGNKLAEEKLNENTIEKLQSDEKTVENHLQSKVVKVNVIHAQNDGNKFAEMHTFNRFKRTTMFKRRLNKVKSSISAQQIEDIECNTTTSSSDSSVFFMNDDRFKNDELCSNTPLKSTEAFPEVNMDEQSQSKKAISDPINRKISSPTQPIVSKTKCDVATITSETELYSLPVMSNNPIFTVLPPPSSPDVQRRLFSPRNVNPPPGLVPKNNSKSEYFAKLNMNEAHSCTCQLPIVNSTDNHLILDGSKYCAMHGPDCLNNTKPVVPQNLFQRIISESTLKLGKDKILLSSVTFPKLNIRQNTNVLPDLLTVPQGVQIMMNPNGDLTYCLQPGVVLNEFELAQVQTIINSIKMGLQVNTVPIAAQPIAILNDIVDLTDDNAAEIDTQIANVPPCDTMISEDVVSNTTHIDLDRSYQNDEVPPITKETDTSIPSVDTNPELNNENCEITKESSPENIDNILTKINTTDIEPTSDLSNLLPDPDNVLNTSNNSEAPQNVTESQTQINSEVKDSEATSIETPQQITSILNRKSLLSDLMEISGIGEEDIAPSIEPPQEQQPLVENVAEYVNPFVINLDSENLSIVPITSFKELKYAHENNASFFELNYTNGIIQKVNVRLSKRTKSVLGNALNPKNTTTWVPIRPCPPGPSVNIKNKEPVACPALPSQKNSRKRTIIVRKLKPVEPIKTLPKIQSPISFKRYLQKSKTRLFERMKISKDQTPVTLDITNDDSESSDDEPLIKKAKRLKEIRQRNNENKIDEVDKNNQDISIPVEGEFEKELPQNDGIPVDLLSTEVLESDELDDQSMEEVYLEDFLLGDEIEGDSNDECILGV